MKIRRISLTLKHSAQLKTRRGERWVGMELSAEADLKARERLGPATKKLAEQLATEFNALWKERVRNGVPASMPVSNEPTLEQAPPITAEAHSPDDSRDEEAGQGDEASA